MYKRPESRGPAAPLPGAGRGRAGPGRARTHPHPPPQVRAAPGLRRHMHGLRPQVGGSSSSAFAPRYFRKSVPRALEGLGAPLIHATSGAPAGPWARDKSCDLAAQTGQERARIFMQLRGTGTQRGLREGSGGGGWHGHPAHATQAAQNPAGGEKRLLLVFPQQSRNKQTMATGPLRSEAQGRGGRVGRTGRGPGIGLRCGSAVPATSRSSGLRGQRGQEPSPQLDPGCRRAGRLPRGGAV